MSKPYGIILLGANGSGKSTLGRELACALNFAHFDVEDYWFHKTDIPYTAIRPQDERNEMLLSDMKKHGSFVVSGDVSGWSDELLTMFDLAVFLTAPTETRMKRIENREYGRWGDRVLEGGDMYESQRKFREFAATRDVGLLEQAASLYLCPILRVDGTKPLSELVHDIEQALLPSFPAELTAILSGYTCTKDRIVCSSSKVFRYERNKDVLYLKITQVSNEIRTEKDLLIWLKDKVPVPNVLYYGETDGYAFLLMTKAVGFMACDDRVVTGVIHIGNGGIADKWQDIALCVRSLGYNLRHTEQQEYIDLLFSYLGIQPNEAKIRYFILLDELF